MKSLAAIANGLSDNLIARAAEGIHSVQLANAMLLSSFRDKAVDLPISARSYASLLRRLIRESTFEKKQANGDVVADMSKSF